MDLRDCPFTIFILRIRLDNINSDSVSSVFACYVAQSFIRLKSEDEDMRSPFTVFISRIRFVNINTAFACQVEQRLFRLKSRDKVLTFSFYCVYIADPFT